MVSAPQDYRWSSALPHLTGAADTNKLLDLGFGSRADGFDTWRELHYGRPRSEEQIHSLRKCTYAGRAFGDDSFIEEMESRFQKEVDSEEPSVHDCQANS